MYVPCFVMRTNRCRYSAINVAFACDHRGRSSPFGSSGRGATATAGTSSRASWSGTSGVEEGPSASFMPAPYRLAEKVATKVDTTRVGALQPLGKVLISY